MATRMRVLLTDDLDGGEAAGTVRFSFEGVDYEIDLDEENTARLREAMAPWIGHARKVTGRPAGRASGSGSASAEETRRVREWARQNGHVVNERGRLPGAVLEAYRAATSAD